MAKFGQGFIQSLTQPGYGLFELGSTLGQAPAMAAEKKAKQGMLDQFVKGSPIQQARILQKEGIRTGNLGMVMQAQQAEQEQLDKGIDQGIAAIKGKMLTLPDSQLDAAEANLVKYVQGVGGDLTEAYGAAEEVRKIKREQEEDKIKYDKAVRGQEEQGVINTFYSVPVENRAKFLEGAANKGFGDLASRLEIRENERALDAEKINAALKDKTTTVDTSGLQQRIDALPDGTASKSDLNERLAGVLEQIPEFTKGETFNAGQRTILLKEVEAINDDIAKAASSIDQANLIDERQLERDVRTMRSKAVNFDPSNAEIEAKAKELEKEKGTTRLGFGTTYKDFMVEARETLIQEQIDQTEKVIADLQGKEEEAEAFTEEQEKLIKANVEEYKDKTREQVIAALKSQGIL